MRLYPTYLTAKVTPTICRGGGNKNGTPCSKVWLRGERGEGEPQKWQTLSQEQERQQQQLVANSRLLGASNDNKSQHLKEISLDLRFLGKEEEVGKSQVGKKRISVEMAVEV